MGKLGDALRAKYPSAKAALVALGLDPSLLDVKRLAHDSKHRGRDGALFDDQDPEMRAARDLTGEEFEREQRRLDRELEDGLVDDDQEEEDPRRWLMHDHEEEPPPDEELAARRRWWMKRAGDYMLKHGQDEAAVRDALSDFPRNGLEHMALDDDVETVMERLTGMGGSSTTGPGYENSPKAGDRKRRARDRRMARDEVRKHFGTDRLEGRGSDMCNFGDRAEPELAMDEQQNAAASDEANAWFGFDRVKNG